MKKIQDSRQNGFRLEKYIVFVQVLLQLFEKFLLKYNNNCSVDYFIELSTLKHDDLLKLRHRQAILHQRWQPKLTRSQIITISL